jgi:hypothetical protein
MNWQVKKRVPFGKGTFWLVSLSLSYSQLHLSSSCSYHFCLLSNPKVLKGTFKGRFASLPRKVLVVVQFTVLRVALIIGTMVVYQQIQHSKTARLIKQRLVNFLFMVLTLKESTISRQRIYKLERWIEMSASLFLQLRRFGQTAPADVGGCLKVFAEDQRTISVYEYAKSLNLTNTDATPDRKLAPSDSNALTMKPLSST